MLGDCQTTIFLWHSLAVTPLGSGLNWGGAMRRGLLQCGMHDCPHWSITSYEEMSVTIWCTTSWGLSSHLSLIFLFPWKVSAFTKTRLPGFRSMVPIFQLYYCFCHWASAVDWSWASWRVALNGLWTVAMYSFSYLVEAPLMGASVLLKVGK